jgi:hypothetical protein
VKTAYKTDSGKADRLKTSKSKSISPAQVAQFISLVEKVGFWHLPTEFTDPPGLDGSVWVIEGMDRGEYRHVQRWSPQNGGVKELGHMLVKFAGMNIRE